MQQAILASFEESIQVKRCAVEELAPLIEQAAVGICERLRRGGTVYLFGNGGSAADAQHLAGELEGRFAYDRPPLRAVCLNSNVSTLTAIGNDYGFDDVFRRPLEAMATADDVVVGLSTSGDSRNVVAALGLAESRGAFRVGFTGGSGGLMRALCDVCLCVPSRNTPRIQEVHITAGHILCELIEREMFPES